MTRRDFHTLAAYTTAAVLLLAVVLFVVMLIAVLDKAAKSAPTTPRTTPSVASRDFARPFLTVPPSDHAAAGRAQTSAGQTQSVTSPSRTADETEGPVVDLGKASTGPTAYEKLRAAISWCESRNQPTVVNRRSGAAGLFQFMPQTWEAVTGLPAPASAYSAQVQTEAFDELFAQQGTRPWRPSRSCWGRS